MVVRMRHTRAHTGNRRSHHALKDANILTCSNCGAAVRNHTACTVCGFYKGKLVKAIKPAKSAE
jgi:large subunit ribosomal protein L32